MHKAIKWMLQPMPRFAMAGYGLAMAFAIVNNNPFMFLVAGLLFCLAFHSYLEARRD